jgi:hypothetical protein
MKRKYEWPSGYDRTDQKSVNIPRKLIPILAGKIDELKYRSCWETDTDWETAKEEIKFVQELLGV